MEEARLYNPLKESISIFRYSKTFVKREQSNICVHNATKAAYINVKTPSSIMKKTDKVFVKYNVYCGRPYLQWPTVQLHIRSFYFANP